MGQWFGLSTSVPSLQLHLLPTGGACKAFTGYAFQQGKDVTNNLLGTAVTGSLETAAAVCSSNCACQSFTSTQLIKSDAVVVTGGGTGTCDGTFVRTINCTAATRKPAVGGRTFR